MMKINELIEETKNEIKELSTKEIIEREQKKKYNKNEEVEKYQIKGTKKIVKFIGKSKPKNTEVIK